MLRLPSQEIEELIERTIRAKLADIHGCADFLGVDLIDNQAQLQKIAQEQAGLRMIDFCNSAIARITVEPEKLVISIKTEQLGKLISEKLGVALRMMFADEKHLTAPIQPAKGKRGTLMIEAPTVPDDILDLPPAELKKLIQGFIWMEEHFFGKSLEEIARLEERTGSYIGRIIMANFEAHYTPVWHS